MNHVNEYQQIARDYKLNPAQKLKYLHNILSKDVRKFYLDWVAHFVTKFRQAIDTINQEYNSSVCQTCLKKFLNDLRVSEYVDQSTEVCLAFAKV